MATVTPHHVIVCANAAELASLKSYLDRIGYTIGGEQASRSDDDGGLSVTVVYPSWVL